MPPKTLWIFHPSNLLPGEIIGDALPDDYHAEYKVFLSELKELSATNWPAAILVFCFNGHSDLLESIMATEVGRQVPTIAITDSHEPKFIKALYREGIASHLFYKELFLIGKLLDDTLDHNRVTLRLRDIEAKSSEYQKLLSTYVSSELVELHAGENGNHKGKIVPATILFFDIRKSTTIAENLNPDIFSTFLSDLLSDVMDLIYGHEGSVNKMLGDGLLASFGCPEEKGDDAFNAVRCAQQIRDYLLTYNDVRPEYLKDPIEIGIGIATGMVFAGNIGSVRRTEYTILGDCVNVASRIENMTKQAGVDILMDEATTELVRERTRVRRVIYKSMRGKKNLVNVYYLKGLK